MWVDEVQGGPDFIRSSPVATIMIHAIAGGVRGKGYVVWTHNPGLPIFGPTRRAWDSWVVMQCREGPWVIALSVELETSQARIVMPKPVRRCINRVVRRFVLCTNSLDT